MTLTEKVICSAYTGTSFIEGDELNEFYKYVEKLIGHPIYTHELADRNIWNLLHERSKDDFLKICAGEKVEV